MSKVDVDSGMRLTLYLEIVLQMNFNASSCHFFYNAFVTCRRGEANTSRNSSHVMDCTESRNWKRKLRGNKESLDMYVAGPSARRCNCSSRYA